jgi:hypothetical protein
VTLRVLDSYHPKTRVAAIIGLLAEMIGKNEWKGQGEPQPLRAVNEPNFGDRSFEYRKMEMAVKRKAGRIQEYSQISWKRVESSERQVIDGIVCSGCLGDFRK